MVALPLAPLASGLLTDIATGPTDARRLPIRQVTHDGILWCEGVSVNTAGLPRLLGVETDAPEDVLAHRNWLKVGWIHTGRISANVVYGKAGGNRPNQMLIDQTVRVPKSAVAIDAPHVDVAVTPAITRVLEFRPRPAFRFASPRLLQVPQKGFSLSIVHIGKIT